MDLYPKNPHLLKKLQAKRQVSGTQSLLPNCSISQISKTKTLLQTLNPEFHSLNPKCEFQTHSTLPSVKTKPVKKCFAESSLHNRQHRPTQAEVFQTPHADIIIITDTANCSSDQSGGESPGLGLGGGDLASSGDPGGDGGTDGDCGGLSYKKIKHEKDHPSKGNFAQSKHSNPHQADKPVVRVKCHQHTSASEQRRQSFIDESECSTNCDTHSDANEISDFSPILAFNQVSRDLYQKMEEEFKLDDDSFCLDTTTCSDEDISYLKEAFDLAIQLEGSCASRKCNGEKALLKFMCKFRHSFDLSLEEVRQKWCPRCHQSLQSLIEYARSNRGVVLNKYFTEKISYQCEKGHTWTVDHKTAKKRWCSRCAKEEKQATKKQIEQEQRQKEILAEELQRKLFEEARRNFSAQNAMNNAFLCGNAVPNQSVRQPKESMISYFSKLEADADRVARKYTADYISSKGFSGDCTQEQILQVYKIIIMPEEVLKTYMFNLPVDALKADFRRLIKLVHPDKNHHAQAGFAFHKIHKIYEEALIRVSSTN